MCSFLWEFCTTRSTIEVLTCLSSPELVGEIMINTFNHNWKSRGQNSLRHKKESSIKVRGSRTEQWGGSEKSWVVRCMVPLETLGHKYKSAPSHQWIHTLHVELQQRKPGLPGGPVVESPPCNARGTSLIPFLGGSHMPQGNWTPVPHEQALTLQHARCSFWAYAPQLPKPVHPRACALQLEESNEDPVQPKIKKEITVKQQQQQQQQKTFKGSLWVQTRRISATTIMT